MKGIDKYEGYKFEKGSVAKVTDPLTVEQPLEISINDKPFTVVMQTPGDEVDLATGLLYAEDVINLKTEINFNSSENERGFIEKINLTIPETEIGPGYLSSRSLLSISSCGICGKQSLEDLPKAEGKNLAIDKSLKISKERLFIMQKTMIENQTDFKITGGCHGVAAFDTTGNMLAIKEDIGRHNAMDKVVGQLITNKQLKAARIIMFSGRISYEIVSKAFRAKIPVIMAVSAPSSLAVDFAKEYGITLLAFSRDGKTTCYSNCNQINLT